METDGIGGVALPDPARAPESLQPPSNGSRSFLLKEPAGTVDVLALGPLTNLARLVLEKPDAAKRIGRIVAMGGAIHERGNVGPRAEFNLWADPEAAAAVVASGLPLVLIPLDVTRRVRASREFTEASVEEREACWPRWSRASSNPISRLRRIRKAARCTTPA